MKESVLTETVQLLIAAHVRHDEGAFRRLAENVVRELSVANRHAEARKIQEFLSSRNGNSNQPQLQALTPNRQVTSPLLNFVSEERRRVNVVLSKETASQLDRVVLEQRKRDLLGQFGLRPISRLMFWGPPGCGKTITAQMLANELGLPFAVVRLSSVITSYVGETAANLSKIFREAMATEMVLLFDEADAIAKDREDPNDVGELKRVVNSLLQNLDEFPARKGLVIFASNHQYMFDPAVWRRFDDVVAFPMPTEADRLEFLRRITNGITLNGSLRSTARSLGGFSFADLERIAINCIKNAVMRGDSKLATAELLTEARLYKRKIHAAKSMTTRRA